MWEFVATGNGVESGHNQHEDGGQVEIPSQTHLNEQGSRVEVSLVVMNTTYLSSDKEQIIRQIQSWRLHMSYRYLREDRQQQ